MKNLFKFLSFLFAAALVSCVQPSEEYYSSGNNSTNTETVTAGWYAYTTNAASEKKQVTYLYINADGSIEKAGSSKHEYTGTSLEMFAQLSYSKCKENSKNDPSKITFEPCDAPSWGGADETGGNDENENENYTDLRKITDRNLQLNVGDTLIVYYSDITVADVEPYDDKYECESVVYKNPDGYWSYSEYLNEDNIISLVDQSPKKGYATIKAEKAGECRIRLNGRGPVNMYFKGTGVYSSNYNSDRIFNITVVSDTEENTGSSGSDSYSPGIGCEWWCFENAHVGNLNVYVLYDQSGNPLKAGTNNKEDSTNSNFYMVVNKEEAVGNFRGKKYKITDYRNLPSWCF